MKSSKDDRRKFSSVIFDLDGTLADTIQDLADATNWGLAELNLPPYPTEDYKLMVGSGRKEMCIRALPDSRKDEADKLAELMTSYYTEHYLDNTKLYPGIEKMLTDLQDAGITMAVLSNKPDNFVKLTVRHLCPKIDFRQIVGDRDGVPRKPDPTSAMTIAKVLSEKVGEIAYLGDTSIDMETAKRANMFAIGVTWGFRDKAELIASGADRIVDRPDEICKIIIGDE